MTEDKQIEVTLDLGKLLLAAVRARDTARRCQAIAQYLRDIGDNGAARILEQRSAWWMTYAISLSQTPPGAVDPNPRD